MPTADEIQKAMTEGITFRGSGPGTPQKEKFKTKAKKKAYITGSHGSGSAKKKADIRAKRASRSSQQKSK